MATIGRRNSLSIIRESAPGLYLNGGELGEILLPGRYIPKNLKQGDKLDVFVYLDSEDRLVATTETPKVMVGEFACLKVISVNSRVGAFLDWGLAKDLLLPFREHDGPVRPGQVVAVYVFLDQTSHRIVASARLQSLPVEQPPQQMAIDPPQSVHPNLRQSSCSIRAVGTWPRNRANRRHMGCSGRCAASRFSAWVEVRSASKWTRQSWGALKACRRPPVKARLQTSAIKSSGI